MRLSMIEREISQATEMMIHLSVLCTSMNAFFAPMYQFLCILDVRHQLVIVIYLIYHGDLESLGSRKISRIIT
jgi:hypothetical protein